MNVFTRFINFKMVARRFIYKGNFHQDGGNIASVLGRIFKSVVPKLAQGAKFVAKNPNIRKAAKSAGKELIQTSLTAIDAASKGQEVSPILKKKLNEAKQKVTQAAKDINKKGFNCPPQKKCPPQKPCRTKSKPKSKAKPMTKKGTKHNRKHNKNKKKNTISKTLFD